MISLQIVLSIVGLISWILYSKCAKKLKSLEGKDELTEQEQSVKTTCNIIRGISISLIFVVVGIFAFFVL